MMKKIKEWIYYNDELLLAAGTIALLIIVAIIGAILICTKLCSGEATTDSMDVANPASPLNPANPANPIHLIK